MVMQSHKLRIFHGPQNISGMAGVLAQQQRELGYDACSHCITNPSFNFSSDYVYEREYFKDNEQLLKFVTSYAKKYDIFHFYFGESLDGPSLRDIPILKSLGKKVFMYFCGCDIRDSKKCIANEEYSACKGCWPMLCSYNRPLALKMMKQYADGVLVSTPDLLAHFPGSIYVPQPINVEVLAEKKAELKEGDRSLIGTKKRPLRIAHAPSSPAMKGSSYLIEAVANLQKKGVYITLDLIQGENWSAAIERYRMADLAVDQLLIGAYGSVSVEMMALGVPVICYLREDLIGEYPMQPPIINANPGNLEEKITAFLEKKDCWEEIREEGYEYVNRAHSQKAIAGKFLEIYRVNKR